jgi:non-specific serine/threonine protein kinase
MLARIRTVGHLPALPGLASRVASLVRMESRPLAELVDAVLDDPALALELLRLLNSAALRRAEPVGSVRQAILLLGLQGVRRSAGSLRAWPGLLGVDQARRLERGIQQGHQAARVALWLAPPGLPADEVKLAVLLQQLGRLLAACHFPEAAIQIEQLMRPATTYQGEARQILPGLDEATAARTVLGAELPMLTRALLRQWGLGPELELLARPIERDQPVRTPDSAAGWLRIVASCAHEAMAICWARGPHGVQAFESVAARYARVLDVSAVDLWAAAERSTLPTAEPAVQEPVRPSEAAPHLKPKPGSTPDRRV